MRLAQTAAEILARAPWPGPGREALARALIRHGRVFQSPAGRWAQGEGDPETGLLIVLTGVIQLFCQASGGREVLIGQLGAGAAIGQTVRLGGGPRLTTVVCLEDSLLLQVSDRALGLIAHEAPEIWQAVGALLYRQLAGLLQQVAETSGLAPRARTAARLAQLSGYGEAAGRPLRISQQSLAEMTGLSRKTVNGHLAGLERDGLIRRAYGAIAILDPKGLRRIAPQT